MTAHLEPAGGAVAGQLTAVGMEEFGLQQRRVIQPL